MKLRLRRPRDLALALRDLARRRPDEAADYLDAHEEEWAALAGADPHDAADILEAIGGAMEGGQVRDIRDLLRYPPDSAGGLMMPEPATLTAGMTAGEAIEALRRLPEGLENMSYVYVVEHDGRLAGVVSFRELVFARPLTALDEVMVRHPVAVQPEADREKVSDLIQRYDLLALP